MMLCWPSGLVALALLPPPVEVLSQSPFAPSAPVMVLGPENTLDDHQGPRVLFWVAEGPGDGPDRIRVDRFYKAWWTENTALQHGVTRRQFWRWRLEQALAVEAGASPPAVMWYARTDTGRG